MNKGKVIGITIIILVLLGGLTYVMIDVKKDEIGIEDCKIKYEEDDCERWNCFSEYQQTISGRDRVRNEYLICLLQEKLTPNTRESKEGGE